MKNKIMHKFLLAALVATLFSAPANASKTFSIQNQKEVKTCKIPPAIQQAYNSFVQKFGKPTSVKFISGSQQGNIYSVVALCTFSDGSVKTLAVSFTTDGSVLNYTMR